MFFFLYPSNISFVGAYSARYLYSQFESFFKKNFKSSPLAKPASWDLLFKRISINNSTLFFLIKEKNKSILVDTNQIIEKNQGIQKISVENFEMLNLPKENDLFPYTIETTKIIDDKLFIEGWLLKKGENNYYGK